MAGSIPDFSPKSGVVREHGTGSSPEYKTSGPFSIFTRLCSSNLDFLKRQVARNGFSLVEDQESSRASSSSRGSNSTGTMTLEERKRALTNKLYNPKTNVQKYVPPSRTARLGQQRDKAGSEETSRTSVDILTMEERRRRLTQSRRFSDKPSAADTAVGKATTNPLHSDGSGSNEGGDDSSTGAPGLHNTL